MSDNSKELQLNGSIWDQMSQLEEEMERRAAQRKAEQEAEEGSDWMTYARIVQPTSPRLDEKVGASKGGWAFKTPAGDEYFCKEFTCLMTDIIGTRGGNAVKTNPTIHRWSVPMGKKFAEDREEFGFNYVAFSDGKHPDPGYVGRTLIDPRIPAGGMRVLKGKKSKEIETLYPEFTVDADDTPQSIQCGRWLYPVDENGERKVKRSNGKEVCIAPKLRPVYKLVVLPIYVPGYGPWDQGLVQLELKGSAARVLFNPPKPRSSKEQDKTPDQRLLEQLGMEPIATVVDTNGRLPVTEFDMGDKGTVQAMGSMLLTSTSFIPEGQENHVYVPVALNVIDMVEGSKNPIKALRRKVSNAVGKYRDVDMLSDADDLDDDELAEREEIKTRIEELLKESVSLRMADGRSNDVPGLNSFPQAYFEYHQEDENGVIQGRALLMQPWMGDEEATDDKKDKEESTPVSEETASDAVAKMGSSMESAASSDESAVPTVDTLVSDDDDDEDDLEVSAEAAAEAAAPAPVAEEDNDDDDDFEDWLN